MEPEIPIETETTDASNLISFNSNAFCKEDGCDDQDPRAFDNLINFDAPQMRDKTGLDSKQRTLSHKHCLDGENIYCEIPVLTDDLKGISLNCQGADGLKKAKVVSLADTIFGEPSTIGLTGSENTLGYRQTGIKQVTLE